MFGFGQNKQLARQIAQLEQELAESRALLAEKTAELQKRIEFDDENQRIKHNVTSLLNTQALVLHTIPTGTSSGSQILELSIIGLNNDVIFDGLIQPKGKGFKINPSLEYGGITSETLENAPQWCNISDRLHTILQEKSVIMYDANFHLRLLRQTCNKYTVPVPQFQSYCLMELYAAWYGWLSQYRLYRTHKLEAAASFVYGGYWQSAHRALPDCRVLLDILRFIASNNMRPRFFTE